MIFRFTSRFFTVLAFLLVLAATAGLTEAKEVTLRNKDGKSLSVSLISCDGDKLTVLRGADKKQFVLNRAQLDDVSRAEVDAWLAAGGGLSEQFEIDVNTGKSGRKAGSEDFDDKNLNIEPLVVVKNPSANVPTRAAKVTAVFLGRPVNARSAYYVFSTETFNLPSIPGAQSGSFQMKKISRNYDDRGYAQFGARYLGYVVLIHDSEDDRIISSKSVPGPLAEKFGRKFLKLAANETYDDNLRLMKNFSVYSD